MKKNGILTIIATLALTTTSPLLAGDNLGPQSDPPSTRDQREDKGDLRKEVDAPRTDGIYSPSDEVRCQHPSRTADERAILSCPSAPGVSIYHDRN